MNPQSASVFISIVIALFPIICDTHPQIFFSDHDHDSPDHSPTTSTTRRTRILIASDVVLRPTVSSSNLNPNPTSLVEDNALRRSLCPTLADNVASLHRYDRITKRCYRGGDQGPCGKNMIFYAEDDSRVYGVCDCDMKNNERALIFHPETNQCHFVYTKGYCSAKKWLIFNQSDRPTCGFNPCYRQQKEAPIGSEYVPYRGKCVLLGGELEDCGEGKVITFIRDKLNPVCGIKRTNGVTSLSVTVPKFRCSPGTAQSISGKCKAVIKFNLS